MNNRRYAMIANEVWDGVSGQCRSNLAVIVDGEKIESTCPVDQVPREIEVVRLGADSVLLPGLIDAHIHYSPWMGPAFLAAGVTSVRDTGNDLDWIAAQQSRNSSDLLAGPQIISCGLLLDGPRPYWHYIGRGHPDANALRASIREEAKRGLRFIKFYDGLDQSFIEAGMKEAKELGLWVLVDFGTDEPKAVDAVRAGINEIEHLTGCPVAWHNSSQAEQDQLIDMLLARKVVMTATLITYCQLGRMQEMAYRFDGRQAWAHPTYRDIWRQIPPAPLAQRDKFQEATLNQKRFVKRLHERGATLAVGTDAPFAYILPGFGVHDELAMFVDAGVPEVASLRAATSGNAALLGLEKEVGRIETGFFADMLVVSGNPLKQIHNIANVECVVRRGRVLPLEQLKARSVDECGKTLDDPITRDLQRYMASAAQKRASSNAS
ncbi:MAG: amidohydrolase family protein [Phycisphaerales bacterium]|nr:amidohydrolase family protein [Phycisphaerales bacterium]